ncbi:MAG TPA: serine hydrolase domain-containing protein [Jatrophihabitans sp.]|nr:serine hydrolase domain-containing protein [Jatrophihabitans sp.]
MTVQSAWQLLDRQLAGGRFPGYAAAVRHRGEVSYRVGGTLALDDDRPVRPDTQFRIASLTKIVAGVLALNLIADGLLALDDPVGRWLPELAEPRVLRTPTGELTDTVPAERPVLVRDLLAFTNGIGLILTPSPIQRALAEAGLDPGPRLPRFDGEEYLARIGALPLAHQPGRAWLYHCGAELLGVLLARAAGRPVAELLAERVTGPLGMASTGLHAPDPSRLVTQYAPSDAGLRAIDLPGGQYARPPLFESLGAGLVSTVEDYLGFLSVFDGASDVLSAADVRLMTTESIAPELRPGVQQLAAPGTSWGLCVGVDLTAEQPWMAPGRFGWTGGAGTTAYLDPSRKLTAVLFTQRAMQSATGDFDDFYRTLAEGL